VVEPVPFSITDPLPQGTVLLEASAGTGKTWTIGALVTRYVAEGVARLEQMLVVTFGRAASQELRERVRAQLVEAEQALSDDEAERVAVPSSELVEMLRRYEPDERRVAHRRVVDALVGFDAATIATTHQFCSMVLDSLGVAGDSDSRARLVEDLDDLVKETVDDLYLRAFALDEEGPAFDYATALDIARKVVDDPQAALRPLGEDRSTTAGRRVSFAEAVRKEMERRKRRLGILSYDDLLSELARALEPGEGGGTTPAAQRMRQRWQIVLVDEFQDTDPVQWQVLDRAFSGHATMVLIGDPKQAIYAFRGGDVTTYLTAAATAATQQTLSVNWRSDAPLLSAVQELLRGAALGDDRILVRDVDAHHDESRLQGAGSPFRVRVIRRGDISRRPGLLSVGQVRPRIARDLAHDVRRLVDSGATFDGRPVRPRDIAVIAYRHADLADAQAALADVGIPGVIAGGGSVFATPAAVEWLTLLEALEQPHRSTRVRAAALTCFFGHTAAALDARSGGGGDELTDEVADELRSWLELFGSRGLAAVLEAATTGGLSARVLAEVGGERRLTDIRHIGEALHEAALTERHGLVSLLSWLREQVAEGRAGRGLERTRRLDSDAAAVQLVTIHASKGLEYPVVYLPALADRHVSEPELPRYHDDEGRRCRNVGAGGAGWADGVRRAQDEDAGEWLRLLYVALTRAQSQVVCWWSPTKNTEASPLHRMLMRAEGVAEVPERPSVPSDDEVVALFGQWRDRGGPVPELAVVAELTEAPEVEDIPVLGVRTFTRSVDAAWRRTSYSSLSAVRADTVVDAVTSEPEVMGKDDEQLSLVEEVAQQPSRDPVSDLPSPMANLPVGATFGSLVHAVLEHADPAAADFRAELLGHIDEQRGWWPVELDREELADALVAVCDSPLGGPGSGLEGITLRGVSLSDRLREMDFELPLAGGDVRGPRSDIRLLDLAPLLERHLPEGDPVRAYSGPLRGPLGDQTLRGYLTGSVDVVLRVPTPDGPRFHVVDYKTNWLGPADEPLTAAAYRPQALDAAMGHSDYPLQALLYAAVLHRFLRWRLPDYDPERHLGEVLYLYVRGMCGPATPLVDGAPCGVFSWRAPVGLVEELSSLLAGRVTA
jgi:exodeoxyribonuclease V beta subunit